ncbi:coiled-coil domain-containing protein 112-like [Ceratina calcarata]|uniref:Coiled-coil domain-containing protein 112-like n=1 Tax=Ceratina calcarata TaxID=156304 RepID=A0AAJ7NFS7_9HYME|nr:coiled-coil domain-containing protein 112-like [Ceratina calcarata]
MNANSRISVEKRKESIRKKITSAEKNLYMKPLLRLKQQEEILEKGLIGAMENMKIGSNLLHDIVHEHRELSSKRQIFLNTLHDNVKDITAEMESVKEIAENPEAIQKLDVNTYKLRLIKLSQKMQDFKKSCPIQTLMDERVALDSELNEFEIDLQKCEKIQQSETCFPFKTESSKGKLEFRDVDDFHSLVAMTGHTENWSTEDHLFFLKMRKKCESIPALVAAIQNKCPDLSIETIVNHEAWYKHYESLREKQKAAVKEWRRRKESDRNRNIDKAEEEINDCNVDNDFSNDTIKEKKAIDVKKTRSPSSSASSSTSEKKELIKKWKMERESKRSMDEEQLRTQRRLSKEMDENRRRRRREKMQAALDEYKRKKSLENAIKETEQLSKEKCKYDVTLVKAFRKQDKEFTKKRNDLISRSKKPSRSELVNIKRVELVEARDYSTLLDSTKVWREKCKTDFPKRSNEPRFIKDVPRICIRWRNEESDDLRI